MDQAYTAKSLLRLTSRLDPKKFRLGRNKKQYLECLEDVNNQLLADEFKFQPFIKSTRAGKAVYSSSTHIDEFALRKLKDNISRAYDVRQANRSEIIEQVIILMREIIPFFVIKLDIKSFYESVSRKELVEKIVNDLGISYRSRQHLSLLLADNRYFPQKGLPRGLGISATLAELYMADFDTQVGRMPGVYFYSRYVDDIIIFSYLEPSGIIESAKKNLPLGLKLNAEKTRNFEFDKKGKCVSPHAIRNFDYLGYNFDFEKDPPKGKSGIIVSISPNKIKKIKNRIMLSIFSYLADGNFQLLKDRLRFLSSNCRMKSDRDNGKLLSGIYYNYRLIDESTIDELAKISTFLSQAIYSKKGAFGTRLATRLNSAQRKELAKNCFKTGFVDKIICRFSPDRLKQIKKCWAYV
jgi:hypothetical protein